MTAADVAPLLERPFGSESRAQLLAKYFLGAGRIDPANAWQHVYRLLLWIDRTTGLAHCYESDKCQPGRPWYKRALRFHDWLAAGFALEPGSLGDNVDWLFREGIKQLSAREASRSARLADMAREQKEPYEGREFPEPGEDPDLSALVREEIQEYLAASPPPERWRRVSRNVRNYLRSENKRKNLVGEGFEDVLASLVNRFPGTGNLIVRTRPLLHEVPGFREPAANEKPRRVDLAIFDVKGQTRILITAKWSVRADREEQFKVDFDTYAHLESAGRDFEFVLVTNEFDAARLCAACDRRRPNGHMFSSVVHVNPGGPLAAYGTDARRAGARLPELTATGRLISLEKFLIDLCA